MEYELGLLTRPFSLEAVEWRISQAKQRPDGKIWAKCLAYITNRAIQDRLDEVFGPGAWQNNFRDAPGGGILCEIGAWFGPELGWVWKGDASGQTDIEAIKGGHSSAMKRAAVQWGIGRYLYRLEEGWATVYSDKGKDGMFYQGASKKSGTPAFRWSPPVLPDWATLKGDSTKPTGLDDLGADEHTQSPPPADDAPTKAEKMERKGYIDEIASYLQDVAVFTDDERRAFGELIRNTPPATSALKAMVSKYKRNWESRHSEKAKAALVNEQNTTHPADDSLPTDIY